MIDAISANLLPYSVQVFLVVLAGALAATLVRVDVAHVRYAYWRGIGLLCLVLPFVQPRNTRMARSAADATGTTIGVSIDQFAQSSVDRGSALAIPDLLLWVILAGIIVQFARLGSGLVQLRRLRLGAGECDACTEVDHLQRVIGARAEVRYVEGLRQPVTFGLFRPVVLLPPALRDHPDDVRRAVVAHELLHVERRDWAWVLVEEVVRAVFWFHPALWWLISHVQLTREEVVDETAVLVTGQRRAYVEALLAFADETPLAPAPAFARRRHLFRRMVQVSKEAVMSSKRIVASCALMAVVVVSGGWYAARAFPLIGTAQEMIFSPRPQDARGPLERSAVPVTPENPVPRRVNVTKAEYPSEAAGIGATARVSVQITLDELGRVAEARVATVDVHAPRAIAGSSGIMEFDGPDAQRLGEAFKASALAAVREWRYEPPYVAPISFPVTIAFSLGGTNGRAGIPPPPPPPPPPPGSSEADMRAPDGAVHISVAGNPPKKLKHVDPVYPPIARAGGVEGVVIIEAIIGDDGRVRSARVLRSIPLLDHAALDAVRQWEFAPTLLNGEPIPVTMALTINFSLQ